MRLRWPALTAPVIQCREIAVLRYPATRTRHNTRVADRGQHTNIVWPLSGRNAADNAHINSSEVAPALRACHGSSVGIRARVWRPWQDGKSSACGPCEQRVKKLTQNSRPLSHVDICGRESRGVIGGEMRTPHTRGFADAASGKFTETTSA